MSAADKKQSNVRNSQSLNKQTLEKLEEGPSLQQQIQLQRQQQFQQHVQQQSHVGVRTVWTGGVSKTNRFGQQFDCDGQCSDVVYLAETKSGLVSRKKTLMVKRLHISMRTV